MITKIHYYFIRISNRIILTNLGFIKYTKILRLFVEQICGTNTNSSLAVCTGLNTVMPCYSIVVNILC